jgi:hypothetical protein
MYKCTVTDQYGESKVADFYVTYKYHASGSWGGMNFYNYDATTAIVTGGIYYQEGKDVYTPIGNVTIPAVASLSDGKTYTVTRIDDFVGNKTLTGVVMPETITHIYAEAFLNTGLTSITVPAGVQAIGKHAIGYNAVVNKDGSYTFSLVPGFVIFGKTGSVAQQYAAANGIVFRDPEAEAIAAWNGIPDGNIAKAKASKPKAAKKSFTVKWKKLSKKKLKKGGVTNYEVQYSLNKNFPMNETTTKFVSKKKGSYKAKKLQSKKTYYVRVRAIRNVNGVKYVGSWSTKKVKVK